MRQLNIYWWRKDQKVAIGMLAQKKGSLIVFEWDNAFLSDPVELSPIKYKKSSGLIEFPSDKFGGLNGLFADHTPDGWGRVLIKRAVEKAGNLSSELSQLDVLCHIGNSGMGALSFEPSVETGENWATGDIDLDVLEKNVDPILAGTPSAALDEFIKGGASPNGMRPKIFLREKDGKFHLGDSAHLGDEWLIKFKASIDSKEIGKIEYAYSQMARDAGVDMAETKLFETRKGFYFGAKRFDRNKEGRLHMHSLSGILDTPPANFAIGYEHLMQVTGALTKDIKQVEKAYRIAVFNIISCNQDDHTKNISFLMDHSGNWKLAPAYDLVFHRSNYNEHKMTLLGKGKPNVKDLETFGLSLGLSHATVNECIENTIDVVSNFSNYAKKLDIGKSEVKMIVNGLDLSSLKRRKGPRKGR